MRQLLLSGAGKSVIATDVMWSDPMGSPGLVENEARGVGLLFGPDVTQARDTLTLRFLTVLPSRKSPQCHDSVLSVLPPHSVQAVCLQDVTAGHACCQRPYI